MGKTIVQFGDPDFGSFVLLTLCNHMLRRSVNALRVKNRQLQQRIAALEEALGR